MYNDPAFLIIGDFILYWHGVFIAIALAIGVYSAYWLRRQQNGSDGIDMLIACAAALPFAFIGSRDYYCWCFPHKFQGFISKFKSISGGFSVLGAVIGAFIGIVIVSLVMRAKLVEMLDAAAPATGFAISFGRLAAMFSGEDLGGVVSAKWLQFFPFAVYNQADGLYRKAFYVWDAFIVLAISLALLWLFRQNYLLHSFSFIKGDLYFLFIIAYFLTAGMFEQYRIDMLLFVNVPYALTKMKNSPVSFALGGLFAAIPLAIMILRNIFKRGFTLSNLWHIPACALFYFGYFNQFLRVDAENEALNGLLLVLSAFALIGVGVQLFLFSSLQLPAPKRQPQNSPAQRSRQPQNPRPPRQQGYQRPAAPRRVQNPFRF